MDKITIDRETFKILASDTRLDILKALDERRKTVTELARELKLNKATVFEHLEKLNQVELVKKMDDDRKWVYYELSWKGKRLLHPERITIALLLSSAGASLATAGLTGWLYARSLVPEDPQPTEEAGTFEAQRSMAPESDPVPPGVFDGDPMLLAALVGLALLFVTLSVIAVLVWRRSKANAPGAGAAA